MGVQGRLLQPDEYKLLVQHPGDVVYLNSLVYHSVLRGFQPGTQDESKWGAIFGDVIVLAQDRLQSFQYATQLASGTERRSRGAWEALLNAFCVMEGRVWKVATTEAEKDARFEAEKKKILEKLQPTEATATACSLANAKWNKKRTMQEKMRKLREKKKAKSASINN